MNPLITPVPERPFNISDVPYREAEPRITGSKRSFLLGKSRTPKGRSDIYVKRMVKRRNGNNRLKYAAKKQASVQGYSVRPPLEEIPVLSLPVQLSTVGTSTETHEILTNHLLLFS